MQSLLNRWFYWHKISQNWIETIGIGFGSVLSRLLVGKTYQKYEISQNETIQRSLAGA